MINLSTIALTVVSVSIIVLSAQNTLAAPTQDYGNVIPQDSSEIGSGLDRSTGESITPQTLQDSQTGGSGSQSAPSSGQTSGVQPSAIGGESGNVSIGGSGNVSVGGSGNTSVGGGSSGLTNPLKATTISGFLLAIIDVILVFALPLIVLYIMYAGFLYVTARGEPGQITTARSALLWAIVGGVIVLGAKLIVSVIQGTIQAF